MKLFTKAPDGGVGSGVTGYFLVEIKSLFSIVLLRFNRGTREAFHSHAFNAVTLWLKGRVQEHHRGARYTECVSGRSCPFYTAGMVKITRRDVFHKINALETSWAISFRGPWRDRWQEDRKGELVTLTHGRREISEAN